MNRCDRRRDKGRGDRDREERKQREGDAKEGEEEEENVINPRRRTRRGEDADGIAKTRSRQFARLTLLAACFSSLFISLLPFFFLSAWPILSLFSGFLSHFISLSRYRSKEHIYEVYPTRPHRMKTTNFISLKTEQSCARISHQIPLLAHKTLEIRLPPQNRPKRSERAKSRADKEVVAAGREPTRIISP